VHTIYVDLFTVSQHCTGPSELPRLAHACSVTSLSPSNVGVVHSRTGSIACLQFIIGRRGSPTVMHMRSVASLNAATMRKLLWMHVRFNVTEKIMHMKEEKTNNRGILVVPSRFCVEEMRESTRDLT
jgi:hypothetical protein